MTTRSYIIYRLATPMLLYLPISFFFAMINLPTQTQRGRGTRVTHMISRTALPDMVRMKAKMSM
jgi:hypothetical protein